MFRQDSTDAGKRDARVQSGGGLTPSASASRAGLRPLSTARKTIGSPYFRIATLLLLVSLIAAGLWREFSHEPGTAKGLAALTSAYRQARPTEARISGFVYAPTLAQRGGEERVDYAARDRAQRLLLDAVAEKPGPASHHALGKAYLARQSLDKAVDQLQQAIDEDSNNSQLQSDLGVALFEMSRISASKDGSDRTLEFLARSLEQVDKALQLDPKNIEALYNRALILPNLKLPEQGKSAWQAYLAQESQPQWIDEAKHNLKVLVDTSTTRETASEMLDSFLSAGEARDDQRAWLPLSHNKEMITGRFIPQELARAYLEETSANRPEGARRFLRALSYAGKLELEKAHDPFVSDIAKYYSRTSTVQRSLLSQAQASQSAGYSSCLRTQYNDALPSFIRAREFFSKAHDEWEARICDYWIGYCESQQDQLRNSTARLTALAHYSESKHYHWLLAQALGWLANNFIELNEHSKAIESANRGLSITEAIDDSYNRQKILSFLGNEYIYMAQPLRALEFNWRTLQLMDQRSTSVRQIWRNYLYTTRALTALHLYNAAAAFGNEMLSLAQANIEDPSLVHFSCLYLAQIYGGEQRFDQAIQIASESLKVSQAISDPKVSRKLSAGSLRLIAHLQRQSGNTAQALKTYDQAIRIYDQMELNLYTYDAHKGRLLCYAALNDSVSFEAELPTVLEQFEQYRVKIREEQNRNAFFDTEQSVYDLAIDHANQKGETLRALDYSEKSRARSLLDSLTNHSQATPAATAEPASAGSISLSLSDIQKRLPANAQLVEYSVLNDKIVIWVITSNSFKSVTKLISSADLHDRISKYVKGIASGPARREDVSALSRELYDLTIAPVAPYLDSRKVLCLIPDKALWYLPFAALISSRSGQYLISEFSVLSSASLNVFLHCTEAALQKVAKQAETILSVGNPSFDPKEYPDLKNLPAATREAEEIAADYSRAYKFIGPAALKGPIEKTLPEANVIHFASHYIIDERHPLLSRLVLAKKSGFTSEAVGAGDLMGSDLAGKNLPRAKLVVLSACRTGGENYYNGEGLIGISRMFLETGIPLVVASQWAVESESTAELMIKFHHYRKTSGVSSVDALRRAQLEMLNDQAGPYRDPYYWAAFIPLGGYTDF